MNATLAALILGATVTQAPAPQSDYLPWPSRTIKLPLQFKKEKIATIRNAVLFVSEDQGQTWSQEAMQPPTVPEFTYTARGDGRFWFNYVLVDLKGNRDITDLTKNPNAMKVLMDATPPRVRFSTAQRNGDEVVVEWAVEDKFPNDDATQVHFRPAGSPDLPWQPVTIPADGPRTGVRFPAGTTGPVLVRVTVQDLVGNKGEGTKEVPAAGGAVTAAGAVAPSGVPPLPNPTTTVARPAAPATPVGDIPPPDPLGPASPAPPAPAVAAVPPAVPAAPPSPPPAAVPAGPTPIASGQGVTTPPPAAAPVPLAATDPPRGGPPGAAPSGYSPVIASGTGPVAAAPSVELTRTQVTNLARFDLSYEVEGRGTSGISRIDLYVTRDDGQTWRIWSQHDGRDAAVRVALDVPANHQVEGAYGFRLVPVSGAGFSEGAPVNGRTVPDMRVIVDTTPPYIELYQPTALPNAPDSLVVRWKATDKHFAADPITVEYAEHPTGPWKSVAPAAGEAVVQASAVSGAASRRLPNTGEYAWRVPQGLPPRVFLKVTARDSAGNVSEVVTPQPVTVDTMTPRAKIQGIVSVNPTPPRP